MSNKGRQTRGFSNASAVSLPAPATPILAPLPTTTMKEGEVQTDFQTFVTNCLTALTEKVDNITRSTDKLVQDNDDLKKVLDYSNQQIDELSATVTTHAGDLIALKTELAIECRQREALIKMIDQQVQRIFQLETYSRRSNLVIEGVEESEGEVCPQIVSETLHKYFKITVSQASIDKAHRFGRAFGDRPRPIMVRFTSHITRDNVLYAARSIKDKPMNIFVNEDLPSEVKSQRADLRSVANHAKASSFNDNKIILGIFLDLSKAFDTVNFQILLNKLHYYGIRGTPLLWLINYLRDRLQYITFKEYFQMRQQPKWVFLKAQY